MKQDNRSILPQLCALVLLAAVMISAPLARAQTVTETNIVRDETLGQTNRGQILPDQFDVYEIHGDDGVRGDNGSLVLHSFLNFDLADGDTALYTDNPNVIDSVKNVLTRITGSNPSRLDGMIKSDYPNADLLFVNRNGVFFGPTFTIDVKQSFHVSTADNLFMRNTLNGAVTRIDTGDVVALDTGLVSAVPEAWGFLADGPSAIEVLGFENANTDGSAFNNEFSFVGGDITFGSEAQGVDIDTNGRSLIVVALGQSGEVAGFAGNPGGAAFLDSQNSTAAVGTIRFDGGVDTSGDSVLTGDVLFWGGDLGLAGTAITTRGIAGAPQESGDVRIIGTDIALDMNIDTRSSAFDAGNVSILALDTLEFGSLARVDSIDTTATAAGAQSGSVQLVGLSSVTANNVQISTGDGTTEGDGNIISLAGDTIEFVNSSITGMTAGDALAQSVVIAGNTVDISGSSIDLTSFGTSTDGGALFATGTQELNITGGFYSARAEGPGNGGTVLFTTANLIGDFDNSVDVSATDPDLDGTSTLTLLGGPPVITVVSGNEEVESAVVSTVNPPEIPNGPDDGDSDDPVGAGNLQPALEAIAAVSASSKHKKEAQIPGVSLFTQSSQSAPLVPRTCVSLDGGESPSKLLARRSKRVRVSPEDWLIAFDTTGDRLIAAAETSNLPSVSAIESEGANLDEFQRSARTQRALIGAAAAVRGGRYEEAATAFEEAVSSLEAAGDLRSASEALLAYAQVLQIDGRFEAARQSLERALALAEPLGDDEHTAAVRASLGNALIGTGEWVRAEAELTRGLNIVIKSEDNASAPSVLNNLGNRHAATRDFDSAIWAYQQSAELARDLGRTGDEARALSGAARAAAESGRLTEGSKLLDQTLPLVASLSETRERVPLYIHIGRTYAQFAAASPVGRSASLLGAHKAFAAAIAGAEEIGDDYGLALANLNLGALYRDEQHRSEALYLTRVALQAAERINAPELLYRAHWQAGQLLWSEHQVNAALAAHRRAVAILEETKPMASDGYGSSDAKFRMTVGSVYRDTVDLMLQAATLATSEDTAEALIVEARDVLENFKAAELRNYFEDECIASVRDGGRSIDALGDDAAVVYTVTLPDRVELLVGLEGGVERFTAKVSAARLIRTVDRFRNAVQNPLTEDHWALGRSLYEWTVAPYADRLTELGIKTLVFIPDGRLRTLPFAALNDGNSYLSERFATATALSLRLLTTPDVASTAGRPLLAGVSESVQGFSALAAVDIELAEIQAIGGGELLLNRRFTLDEVRNAVEVEIPSMVHLATHAVFTGNPDTSFLLTYSGRVGFDDLADVVGMTRADGAPLELLVLSACETAVGNDRAGLGFAGIAIRAGARSALGSLWSISDAAAGELMVDFYRRMQMPELSKAQALQQSQASLRDQERFAHPFYWAPFTLINDWL